MVSYWSYDWLILCLKWKEMGAGTSNFISFSFFFFFVCFLLLLLLLLFCLLKKCPMLICFINFIFNSFVFSYCLYFVVIKRKKKEKKLAIDEFNNQFLSSMLEKVSFENKKVYVMGDFNINLLNYESNQETADFLNNMHWNSHVPYIALLNRITPRPKTLIDNIFLNEINEAALSGNLVTDIWDHYAQFLIASKILENDPNKVTLRRFYENFNNELLKNDLLKTDWESLLKTNLNDANFSFE